MIGEDGRLPLPWLSSCLQAGRAMGHAHALLLHGAAGAGSFEAACCLAQSALCESPSADGWACGHCAACHQLRAGLHPDLMMLVPEASRQRLGLPGGEGEAETGEGKARRRPSRQIRIDEVRAALDWTATSSSRGRGKWLVVHPAEALNVQSANALLKSLEEPPAGVHWVLTAAEPQALLPTVRSRCQRLRLATPPAADAGAWLASQGVADPEILLAACDGRPLDARDLNAEGVDARRWLAVPAAVLSGQASAFTGWSLARVIDALQKLCHDGLVLSVGGPARYFPGSALRPPRRFDQLSGWHRELGRIAARADHPWQEALLVESLVTQARQTWQGERQALDTLPS